MTFNRRSLFTLFAGGVATAAASRVNATPATAAAVEYDFGTPHAFGTGFQMVGPSRTLTDPCHTHSYTWLHDRTRPSHYERAGLIR